MSGLPSGHGSLQHLVSEAYGAEIGETGPRIVRRIHRNGRINILFNCRGPVVSCFPQCRCKSGPVDNALAYRAEDLLLDSGKKRYAVRKNAFVDTLIDIFEVEVTYTTCVPALERYRINAGVGHVAGINADTNAARASSLGPKQATCALSNARSQEQLAQR